MGLDAGVGAQFIRAPWVVTCRLAIRSVLAFNLIGDGLRDASIPG
jgi:ABC-type dipeptide/oligopeptide/nickel transport system permease subunit